MLPDIRPCFDGDQWTHETRGAWLAGYFDRAGKIDLGKRRPVSLRIYDQHPNTLALIQQHLRVGRINRHGPKLHGWHVTEPDQVWRVINMMVPFLTTQREAAYQAMDRLREYEREQQKREDVRRKLLALWFEGHAQEAIAQVLGVSAVLVAEIINEHRRGPSVPDAMVEDRFPA